MLITLSWVSLSFLALICALIGFAIGRANRSTNKICRDLDERLKASEASLSQYKQSVNGHFSETAELINQFTENYRKIHEHLVKSSLELCNQEIAVDTLAPRHKLGKNEPNTKTASRYAAIPPESTAASAIKDRTTVKPHDTKQDNT